jgi:hypothetical protein
MNKLYHNYNRFAFLKSVPKSQRDILQWALNLSEGDIINDCSGFNVAIRSFQLESVKNSHGGWYIYDVQFTTEPHGGCCSLMNCGVGPAKSSQEITKYFTDWYDNMGNQPNGWEYKTEKDIVWQRLNNRLPICDDKGMWILGKEPKRII